MDDVREDSGFHSCGPSSVTSSSSAGSSKLNNDIRPGRLAKCESIDLKEVILNPRTQSEFLWTKSKIDAARPVSDRMKNGSDQDKMGGWINKKFLKKLSSLTHIGLSRSMSCKGPVPEQEK